MGRTLRVHWRERPWWFGSTRRELRSLAAKSWGCARCPSADVSADSERGSPTPRRSATTSFIFSPKTRPPCAAATLNQCWLLPATSCLQGINLLVNGLLAFETLERVRDQLLQTVPLDSVKGGCVMHATLVSRPSMRRVFESL